MMLTIGRWVYDYAGNPIYVFYTTETVGDVDDKHIHNQTTI